MGELYNVHEHNHTEWPLGRLDARGKELSASIREAYLSPERRAQVQSELSLIAFELWSRHEANEVEFVKIDAA